MVAMYHCMEPSVKMAIAENPRSRWSHACKCQADDWDFSNWLKNPFLWCHSMCVTEETQRECVTQLPWKMFDKWGKVWQPFQNNTKQNKTNKNKDSMSLNMGKKEESFFNRNSLTEENWCHQFCNTKATHFDCNLCTSTHQSMCWHLFPSPWRS